MDNQEWFVMMKYSGRNYTVKVVQGTTECTKLENAGYEMDCGYSTEKEAKKEAKNLKQFLG
jgi:hypothetical protein